MVKNFFIYIYVLFIHWCVVLTQGKKYRKDSVLLLRCDSLGDFVLWLDSAKEYRTLYKNKKIILVVNQSWVSLANRLGYWDEVR